ncbi:hypothetical protein PC129_g1157 [Phytophthora cactorum]|uniref:Uncharacterized protein n=1 Tax=Phytophthora cactorum TaxID=29920 RepID=A0A329REE0_9STRA|nr:hypothetical protein Pcac1_g20819 [Phytophthora cactorum]KAG2843535.1 hypothetical protein PC112_g2573 [Phytophthora cactorum]KAG2845043.1 hypothetical protein PC111_g1721 [Phytophthora cactorum]KAG2866782.1 hypothetical protein PC113_g2538 [Phytophthora cactorum]KAG2929559.1 hypothetical protein PC114_g2746 [Phytophthora cactorum]
MCVLTVTKTGRCEDDRFGYVYIMSYYNGKAMEAFIFSFLEGFRYGDDRRELFHIHLDVLMRFMKVFEHIALDANKMFNDALSKYYDSYHDLEPALVDHFFIHTTWLSIWRSTLALSPKKMVAATSRPSSTTWNYIRNRSLPSK